MNLKFAIKPRVGDSEKEGDEIVRFTGSSEIYRQSCERRAIKVGETGSGINKEPHVLFVTGLEEESVDHYDWLSDEEKTEVKKLIKANKPKIESYYGGSEYMKPDNKSFWTSDRAWGRVAVDNYTVNTLKNTKDPKDCLLYLGIISGAFMDMIAPSKEFAETHSSIPFYLALEDEAVATDAEDYVTKLDAQAALADLAKNSGDGLFILAWILQYDSATFGAYSRVGSTKADLIKYHSMYIDGLIVPKKGLKRNAPKLFIEAYNRFKGAQTKPKLMVEAYVKAGEYFAIINKGSKKYQTKEGTVLGNTIPEAVETLMKAQHTDELERIRDEVEKKWNE
jgi:hypothetical protein